MNAPLSRFLVSFAAEPPPPIVLEETLVDEALVTDEADAAIDQAVREAVAEVETRRDGETAALLDAHERTLVDALAAARATWVETEGAVLSARLDVALAELRTLLSDRIADVLRPLLSEAVVARSVAALDEALALVLADDAHPCLTVRGPDDLLNAIGSHRDGGLRLETIDSVELSVSGDGSRIETRLARALVAINGAEC